MTRLVRVAVALCALSVMWALLVAVTGGFVIHLHSIRLASRSPLHGVLLAILGGAAAWALSTRDDRRMARDRWLRWRRWLQRRDPSVIIAAGGIALTIYRWAGGRPLWLDEEMIALNLRDRRLVDLAGPLWLDQSAPFGWLAVQRAVVLTLGTGERALRLLPMLFGIATLALAFQIGRRWMTRVGAAILMLLCTFGQWLSFYSLELKHYSADTFWALLLPTLGTWVLETRADGSNNETRLAALWWIAAAAGHWFANGGLLVTPACALVLAAVLWRRHGWRAALVFGLLGSVWLASFALHYQVALRDTVNSEFLRRYWSSALPPAASGLTGTLSWFAAQFKTLALNPGGANSWVMFWLTATCGFALSTSPTLGLFLATVPLSAFALAALRLVPMRDRLSLWVVPALYVGIALFSDRAARLGHDAYVRRGRTRLALAIALALVGSWLCADIVSRGSENFRIAHWFDSNHQLDDRTGVRWLMRQRRPGDALMATRLALPALWWYGGIPISNRDLAGGRQADSSPMLEVGYGASGPDCQRNQLRDALKADRRVLVYFGFRFDDVPSGFDGVLLRSFGELGNLAAFQNFAEFGHGAVFELPSGPDHETSAGPRAGRSSSTSRSDDGCVVVHAASRW